MRYSFYGADVDDDTIEDRDEYEEDGRKSNKKNWTAAITKLLKKHDVENKDLTKKLVELIMDEQETCWQEGFDNGEYSEH
jgi:hypothetical protein